MTTSATFFEQLGRGIEAAWSKANYDEHALPEIAQRALEANKPSDHVTPSQIIEHTLFHRDRGHGAPEANVDFGQPNISVFVAPRFYIEALFWLDGSTSIHQHSFSGAFHVLAGGSVHTRYELEGERRFNDSFRIGRLVPKEIELLRKGSVRRIVSGPALIHSLFHIDYPSVSIVVRTPNDPDSGVQFDYSYPGIAHDPFRPMTFPKLARRTFEMLRKSKNPQLHELAVRYLRTCEVREAYELLLRESRLPGGTWVFKVLDELGDTPYASALPTMRACLEEEIRLAKITAIRSEVTSAELRFTLGVLINSRDKATLYRLLSESFPGAQPKATFLGCLRQLAAAGIGFPADDSSIDLIDPLLDGATDEQVFAELITQFGDEAKAMRESIFETCAVLRAHPLLTSVLSG